MCSNGASTSTGGAEEERAIGAEVMADYHAAREAGTRRVQFLAA